MPLGDIFLLFSFCKIHNVYYMKRLFVFCNEHHRYTSGIEEPIGTNMNLSKWLCKHLAHLRLKGLIFRNDSVPIES